MSLALLSLIVSMASAADSDGDGCEDSYFDANSACVAASAVVGSGASVGANAVVGSDASIGTDTQLDADTYVGAASTLVGRVGASGARVVGTGTVIGRRVYIDADHTIGADNSIARTVDVGERLTTGANVTIGYGATLGDDVTLNSGSTIGALVGIGTNTTVDTNAVLARGVTIADSASSASVSGVVGPNVDIGGNVSLASTSRIRKNATLGNDVTVLGGARVARDANIGDGVTIGANARIGAGATVTATTLVPDGITIARGETYDDPSVGDFAGGTLLNATEMDQINTWVGDPNANWTLCYKASVDGIGSSQFRAGCAGLSPTVTVVSANGKKFGGYAPVAWTTVNAYSDQPSAFIFSLTNSYKHPQISGDTYSVRDLYLGAVYGPTFGGGHDLVIFQSGNSQFYCHPGYSYACRVGTRGSNTCAQDFCGANTATTNSFTDVEVYSRD